jgi:PAS domain S-box-containing protein
MLRSERIAAVSWRQVRTNLRLMLPQRQRAPHALRQERTGKKGMEREHGSILNALPALAWSALADGRVDFLNCRWREYTGDAVSVQPDPAWQAALFPDDLARWTAGWQTATAAQQPWELELRLRRADGMYRWFMCRAAPLVDAAGRIIRWYGINTDIDDRRRTELELRAVESKFSGWVESFPGLMVTMSATGQVELLSSEALEYFGRRREDLRNWSLSDAMHPDDLTRVLVAFTASVTTGNPYSIEHRCRRADGVYRWFQIRAHAARGAAGQVTGWYVVLVDIDDVKRAEEAMRASERQLTLTVNAIPVLAWSTGPDGAADFFNQHYLDYVGLSARQAAGWEWITAVHPDDREGLAAAWHQMMARGQAGEAEARLRRHDGEYRWLLFRTSPLRDEKGNIVRWYGVNTDIEDRKRAESALQTSERNLRQLTETIPEMLWSATPEGAIEYCNTRFLRYTGFSPDAVRGDGWKRTIHPDDAARAEPVWRHSARTGEPYRVEVRTFHAADGTYRWCAVSALPLLDQEGRVLQWHGTIVDVHDWKLAEERLRRSEALLAEAQHISATGSFSWNPSMNETVWSDEVYRIFELDRDVPLTEDRIAARIHPEDFAAWREATDRTRMGHDLDLEHRLLLPNGTVKHLHAKARMSRDENGHLEGLGAVQDVTARKLADEALDKVRSELARVSRITSFGALTATIAHEVNQPLSGIVTNAGTCLRMLDTDPPNIDGARETARRTIRDGNRASDVVARLRTLFSRREFTPESFDLNDATREVIALLLNEMQRNRVVVQSELGDDLPLVTGDRVQLQQVMLNLLRNATEAMEDVNHRTRELIVRTEREEDDRVRLIVRDVGVGLEAQQTEKLFEGFHTTKSTGMGIGLSVSRLIIERHHGRIWATPNDGVGATFAFSIPSRHRNE